MLPIELVNTFYCGEIKRNVLPRNVHCDWSSEERGTHQVKKKYLLLMRRSMDLGIFLFYALTTRESACPHRAKVSINQHEYKYRNNRHICEPVSFINVEKVSVLETDDIIYRMRDQSNLFSCVARVHQLKFDEIKSLSTSIRDSNSIYDESLRTLIRSALYDADISTDFVVRFGI